MPPGLHLVDSGDDAVLPRGGYLSSEDPPRVESQQPLRAGPPPRPPSAPSVASPRPRPVSIRAVPVRGPACPVTLVVVASSPRRPVDRRQES